MSYLGAYLQEQAFGHLELSGVPGGTAYKEFLRSHATGGKDFISGPGHVANNYAVLRYGFPMYPRYATAVMTAKSIRPNRSEIGETVYGYAYWPLTDAQEIPESQAPEYVCLGGTFLSQDGEYRSHLLWWKEFEDVYLGEEGRELISEVETRVLEMIAEGNIELSMHAYPLGSLTPVLTEWADELRLLLKVFIAQILLAEKYYIIPHRQPSYREAMEAPMQGLEDLITTDSNTSPQKRTLLAKLKQGFRSGNPTSGSRLRCGQKIIPLMRAEATQMFNIIHPTWREIWASEKMSDLKLNGRVDGLPFFNQWFAINKIGEELFENQTMLDLFRADRVVRAALAQLQATRRAIMDGDLGSRANLKELMDAELYRGVLFGEERLLLSDIAVVLTGEWVGETLAGIPHMKPPLNISPLQGNKFETVLFGYAYACLAMHEVGVHSDLHMNNITVHRRTAPKPGLCAAYVAGPEGQADTYVLPDHGMRGCIIDYSRLIVNPEQKAELERGQGAEQTATFFRAQATRVLMAIDRWLPAFAKKHQEKLKGAALARGKDLYNVLTALDYLALGHNIGELLRENGENGYWKPSPKCLALCEALEEAAREELIGGLQAVALQNNSSRGVPKTSSEVGRRIMRRVFQECLFSNWDPSELEKLTLVNIVSTEAPIKYSGESVETFPPWIQPQNLVRFGGGKTIDEILSRGDRPLISMLELRGEHADGIDQTLELAIEEERAKLADKPPPSAVQSWL